MPGQQITNRHNRQNQDGQEGEPMHEARRWGLGHVVSPADFAAPRGGSDRAESVEEFHHGVHRSQDEERQRQGHMQLLSEEMTGRNDARCRSPFSFPASLGQYQEVPKEKTGEAADNDGPENYHENRGQRTAHAEATVEMKQQTTQQTEINVPLLPHGRAEQTPARSVLHAEKRFPPGQEPAKYRQPRAAQSEQQPRPSACGSARPGR